MLEICNKDKLLSLSHTKLITFLNLYQMTLMTYNLGRSQYFNYIKWDKSM